MKRRRAVRLLVALILAGCSQSLSIPANKPGLASNDARLSVPTGHLYTVRSDEKAVVAYPLVNGFPRRKGFRPLTATS